MLLAALLPRRMRFVSNNGENPVKSSGVLRVGTEGVYSPFSYHDPATGQLVGYDVDVAKAVADKLGVKVEFVETPWDAIFAALEANRFDVVANQVTINAERKAEVRPVGALFGRRRRHRHPRRRQLDQVARRPQGQGRGRDSDQQLGPGRPRRRGTGRVRRGLHPGHQAAQPGPGGRRRQRQHRGVRLPRRDRATSRSRSPGRPVRRASRASPPARTAGCCPT